MSAVSEQDQTDYFCTLFDSGYLLKGYCTLTSLKAQCPSAYVFVLCMNDECFEILTALNLPFVSCIRLEDVETPALLEAKEDRSVAEYCWTLSSCFTWHVMETEPHIDFITYLDADLLFYSPVQPLFDEIGERSIAIIEHRFPPHLIDWEVNGRFCVEWVSFRRDEEGMACLSRWKDQCIEWCYYRLEDDRMGDQKYLDEWPDRYAGCHIIQALGAGVAPWNYCRYDISSDDEITVDGAPLIFYHFHQFQMLGDASFDRISTFYSDYCPEPDAIYARYESALQSALFEIRKVRPDFRVRNPYSWLQRVKRYLGRVFG